MFGQIQAEIEGFIPVTRLREELDKEIKVFNKKFPEKNGKRVFIMIRLRSNEDSRFSIIENAIREILSINGLQVFLASDYTFNSESIWRNVCVYLFSCEFGIAVLEQISSDENYLNPNVLLELGFMMGGLGKPCLVLKERKLKKLPTDILSHLYEEFDPETEEKLDVSVKNAIKNWINKTLKIQGYLSESDAIRNHQNKLETSFHSQARVLSKIAKLDLEKLYVMFDFDAESTVPPLIIEINEETRVENQRIATVILLHANYILNQTNKLSSSELKVLLERSDVESDELNKAFKGAWSRLVKIEGKKYRITAKGRKKAKELLLILSEKND
ncbi:MAG: TIR domain-containing protein [Candidatus Hodarchaeales archaeon]